MEKKRENVYINPFPVTAVANFYNSTQNSLIVETTAIKKTKKIVSEWIKTNKDGVTIAIQGEYGTGKTQLAIELRKYIRSFNEEKYHFICLDSPSISFFEMYKNRFLIELTKRQVLERLEEYYLEIVVSDLIDDALYGNLVQSKQKLLKSNELIEKLGLPKSKYDRIFESNLGSITRNVKFVPALLLLMMPQFEVEVWEWFNGGEPSEALKERGVNFSINSDMLALESIGVFAFLFAQQEHKFVLFIDEMEKIISNTEQTKTESFEALKKLFETVKVTKSMLILCGLQDYYEALPKDAQQRISYEVKTKSVSLMEIKKYISNANQNLNNITDCFPFSERTIENILDISNGNIRTIIRLLYHSCNWYIENEVEIDEKALCDILKNAYGTFDTSNVSMNLAQIIISKGWLFEENRVLMCEEKTVTIDFWLPSILTQKNAVEKGIEIYIVQNVISENEYQHVFDNVCSKSNNCRLIIVEGFISEKYYNLLLKNVNRIMKYRASDFNELFISVIEGEMVKYEKELNQDNLLITNEKIEQLSRIVSRAFADINENFMGKQEFYYFMRSFVEDKNEVFYEVPSKESEFYLIINEIQKIIDNSINIKIVDRQEIGALYLIREITYIIYYMVEKPQKMRSKYTFESIYLGCRQLQLLVRKVIENGGRYFDKKFEKYQFLLEYLCRYFEPSETINYIHRKEELTDIQFENIYGNYNLLEASNRIKQVSQNFCAFILVSKPEVINTYGNVFVDFYYFIYVAEPAIIKGGMSNYNLEILREYYDLIKRYMKSNKSFISKHSLSELFENYERGLRRIEYEREF